MINQSLRRDVLSGFKVAEEKAAEWGVTPQHVQSLCRKGRVSGAVKRSGIWFIPDDAPNPTKNTKSDDEPFQFAGTKKEIFDRAIELFELKGFDNVSVQDIATAVGIRLSAVYNHFKSKQEILDTIYDFYNHYYLVSRPSLEDLEPILQNGSFFEIISSLHYAFNKDIVDKMFAITKIVYHRKYIDEHARELTKRLTIEEGERFVEAVFKRAIEIGRFAPIDTHAMAVFINGVRVYTLQNWVVDPSPGSLKKADENEFTLYRYAASLLTDLKTPAECGEAKAL